MGWKIEVVRLFDLRFSTIWCFLRIGPCIAGGPSIRKVGLTLVLHEIMVLDCDLVLLEPLLVARVRVPAKHK
jgi:hypothetical protein